MRVALTAAFAVACARRAAAQENGAVCPPIDAGGNSVPALCVDDTVGRAEAARRYTVCQPSDAGNTPPFQRDFALGDFNRTIPDSTYYITVVANYETGCGGGLREAPLFVETAQNISSSYPNVKFLATVKGSGCSRWVDRNIPNYRESATPLATADSDRYLRDTLFTVPTYHPSYVVLDWNLRIRAKWIGPCFGYNYYANCEIDSARQVQRDIVHHVLDLLDEVEELSPNQDCSVSEWSEWGRCSETCGSGRQTRTRTILEESIGNGQACPSPAALLEERSCPNLPTCIQDCEVSDWSAWSDCSRNCGTGISYRNRSIDVLPGDRGSQCPNLVETRSCRTQDCQNQCIQLFGNVTIVATADDGLSSVRGFDFHPNPGTQLGSQSEGRSFVTDGDEIWAANGHSHDITIITGVESRSGQPISAINRLDRGYYHYMQNITSLSFNKVSNSGRSADRDGFGYFATCQDSENTYLGSKQPNFFMGPSLYDSRPTYKNLVGPDGGPCIGDDKCAWLHADMLHESPDCSGILHDPELNTAYGLVYWAIDGYLGQLVRYDFQKPHGPGLMEHSAASVRRYIDVTLTSGPDGVPTGMVIDNVNRILYLSDSGAGTIHVVHIDTGVLSRDARTEYNIFSSRQPQFEYSVWECVDNELLESTFSTPSGLALTNDGMTLFVAEYFSNSIHAVDLPSGVKVAMHQLPGRSGLSNIAIAPSSGKLYFSNQMDDVIGRLEFDLACTTSREPIENPNFDSTHVDSLEDPDECSVSNELPSLTLYDQVHGDSGYADADASVQNESMWAGAALLADRTDCEPDSELNNDALLLGGYFCHTCLPDPCTKIGGACSNIWWRGYTCSNKWYLQLNLQNTAFTMSHATAAIANGVDYPLATESPDVTLIDGINHIVVVAPGHRVYLGEDCSARHAESAQHAVVDSGILTIAVNSSSAPLRYCSERGIRGGLLTVTNGTAQVSTTTTSPSNIAMSSTRAAGGMTDSTVSTEHTITSTSSAIMEVNAADANDDSDSDDSGKTALIVSVVILSIITVVAVAFALYTAHRSKSNTPGSVVLSPAQF